MAFSLRRFSAPVLSLAVAAAALAGASVSEPRVTDASDDLRPAFASTCIGYCKHPTNAAKVFRWGLEEWRQEFEVGTLGSNWKSNRPRMVRQQVGMLTINARPRHPQVVVWASDQSARYGRWEARVRAVEWDRGRPSRRFHWELVPTGGERCTADTLTLASYKPDDATVRGALRTGRNDEFSFGKSLDLRSRAWHTYAVEITPKRVSWFVDTKVIHSETRPAALDGVALRPQFRLERDTSEWANRSRMQMDWVRYYDLDRPNAKSTDAPGMQLRTFDGTC